MQDTQVIFLPKMLIIELFYPSNREQSRTCKLLFAIKWKMNWKHSLCLLLKDKKELSCGLWLRGQS